MNLQRKIAPLALTTVMVAVALLMAYGLVLPAMAQNDESALGSLNLTSDTPGEIEVSWTAPSLAPSDYRLSWTPDGEAYPSYRDANQPDRGNAYPGGDQTSLTLTGLTAGTEYKVQVRARYNDGEHADQPWAGPWREAAVTVAGGEEPDPTPVPEPTSTPVPEPTPTPTPDPANHDVIQGLSLASSEPGQMVVTWEIPETTPTNYRISWAQSSLSFPSYKDTNVPEKGTLYPLGSETTLTLNNLTPGVDYKIKMRARYYNEDRSEHLSSGPWTDPVTQRVKDHPPAAPTGLTADLVEHNSLTLSWNDPQDTNITGYRILRGTDPNSLLTIEDNNGSTSVSYTDSTVEPETTYHYGVLALSQDGDGAQSTISVTTPAEPQPDPPAAPTGLTASDIEHDTLTLTWDDPEDDSITGYRVLRGPDADSLSTLENDTESASTEYEDATVEPETTYFYGLLALSQDGNSVQSDAISATTPAAPSSGEQDTPREAPNKEDPPQRAGARQATITTLSLSSGTLRPTFVATTKEYRAAVKYNISRITVTATAANSGTVEYLDASDFTLADADVNTNGFQVDLGIGETAFKVKVTSGATTETYTVTVERDSAQLFGWTPSRDINALEAAGNTSPKGIWSDRTTIWVADETDDKLYAYTLTTGVRDAAKDIDLDTANGDPQGIWSDETTIWVVDDDDDKLYAYTMATGARDATKEISLLANNGDPAGIWSDGTTIWVANNSGAPRKMFAYTLSDGANDTAKEFVPNWNPVGIWAHGTTMWVISYLGSSAGNRVETYTIDLNTDGTAGPNHGRLNSDKRFVSRSNFGTTPVGIWSDGKGAVWIMNPDSTMVESYNVLPFAVGGTTLSALTINDGTNNTTLRPVFASTTLNYRTSVADNVNQVTASATPSVGTATVAYLDENGEALEDADSNTTGFQVEVAVGTTPIQILVTAQDGAAFIHEAVVERDSGLPGGWTPTDDLYNLDPVAVNYPRGIWSDGTTMWLTNISTSTVFAYTLATSTRDTDKEFSLHADNDNPWGLWSDETTIWVADETDDKLYAYTLTTGARDAAKDIDLDTANNEARSIWSDETTVWITDGLETQLYAYTLATGARDAAKEFELTANTQRTGIWSDGTTLWVADFDADTLFAYTLANGARDLARDIILSQPFPQGVSGKGSTIWIADAGLAVLGVPTPLHRVYSYRLPPSSPNDVTLSSLSLSPSPLVALFTSNLRPAFSYARASYRVAVPNQASRVTVSAVANNSGTMVAYLDANGDALVDADDDAIGFQVDVAVGETEIAMRLASGGTALTYTVVVERDSATLYGWTPSKDFNNLLQNNPSLASDQIRGVWGDETTIYTAPLSVPKVFAYTRATEARDESKDIATNQGSLLETDNGFKAGIWSNGTTMWVLNYRFGEDTDGNDTGDGTGKLFAFKLSDGTRDTAKEFALHLEETFAARGIWSDGTTVWISNYKDAKLFAYTLATGAHVPASDITLHHLNDSAQGIWSDETTIWVAQWDSPKFFAYTLATGAYDPDKDFDRVPGNHFPRGVWSDGTTLYVTDYYDKKLFAYKMANSPPTVENAIPDQSATVGTEFSYTFLANTFNDADTGDTLTYSAKKADDSALPTWLTFTDTTRTFSGTPTAAGTISVKVTASDGTASVSDEFDIRVSTASMPLAVTQIEDRRYNFTESDFSNLPGGRVTLTQVIITELPNNGWLARGKKVLLPSGNYQLQSERIYSRHLPLTLISEDNRQLRITFFPEANGNGTPYASFKFKVNSSTDEHTMLINITPVNDPAYGRVFITGTTQVGYTLKAFTSSIGDRDGIPRDQLNYQWKRYAANGTTFETNIGANSSSYRVTDNDVGKKIKLEVTFTDNEGTDEGPLTSPAFPYIATQTVGEATFISTIGMAGDSFHQFASQDQGQVFTTGTNPNGYTVTSVVIISEDSASDDVALKICGVDESLHPTAVCTDLTAPGTYPAGPLVFTAPSGTMLAGGRTNYMVVFDSPGGESLQLDAHVSDGYDSNSLAGFSIRNRIHNKTGNTWQESSSRKGLRIAVLGTINP